MRTAPLPVLHDERPGEHARHRLHASGYAPTMPGLRNRPWLWAAALSPWLRLDDRPFADRDAARLQPDRSTSTMPATSLKLKDEPEQRIARRFARGSQSAQRT